MKRRNFLQLLAASAAGAALTMSSAEAKNAGRRIRITAGNRQPYLKHAQSRLPHV